ncbi:hypothetical protein [Pyrobaculum sp.]|uniref:hypothetical protein n=1 Tax=Pyrobaculum sp. TaxID=2004705 RepID=UPI0031620CC2
MNWLVLAAVLMAYPLSALFWLVLEPSGCMGPLPGRLKRALVLAAAFTAGAALVAVLADYLFL